MGSGLDPHFFPAEWCRLCLPVPHPSGLSFHPSELAEVWHHDRGQRPGEVPEHVEVVYALDPRPDHGLGGAGKRLRWAPWGSGTGEP